MKILDALWLDLRYAIRRLRQSPGLTLTAMATIVVVLVANTAIFSLVNAIVLRKVAIANPEQLIAISAADARTTAPGYFYLETFNAFRSVQQSFSHLSMYNGGGALRVEPQGMATVTVGVEAVSPEYFAVTRVRASAGRLIADADDPSVPVVVLSHRFAQRVYGDAASAAGRRLSVSGVATTVVGVVEPGFTGVNLDGGSDLFVSFPTLRALLTSANPAIRSPQLVGRLAAGKSIDQARAELVSRWPSIQEATIGSVPAAARATVSTQLVQIETLQHGFSGLRRQYGDGLVVLMGLAAVLLALGAVNLSGLLLARNLVRHHQFAVQRALGATPARLIRQALIDGVCLALSGLVVAMPIAWWVVRQGVTSLLVARALPLQRPLTPDANVVAIAILTTVVTGVLIGVLPARRALKASADGVLRGGRAVAGSMGWAGRAMIVAQVALALILVSGAGLFAATLANLYANDSATRTKPILWTRLWQNTGIRGNPTDAYLRSLVEALGNVRGVDAAALSFYYPAYLGFPGPLTSTTIAPGGQAGDSSTVTGMFELVTPGFFELAGIARVRGRDFTWSDSSAAAPIAIVSASVADRLFPDADPVGRDIQITTAGVTTRLSIVGVVANTPIGRIDEPDVPVVFRPMMQNLSQAVVPMAHVRVNGDLAAARDGYVDAVNSLGRHEVRALFTMDDWVDNALLQQRLVAGLSASSAAIALLLAALGIFGVLAYSVTARVREIGIRMSVGASQVTIARMILREGGTVLGIGLAIGLPLAILAARVVRAQLYGVSPDNPALLAVAVVIFVVTGVLAAWLPARRASRIAPVEALRQD